MTEPVLAPDWPAIFADLLRAGLSTRDIGEAIQLQLSDRIMKRFQRMVSHYRSGAQPTYWRGKLLVDLWVTTTKRTDVPMTEVIRGHRAANRRNVDAPKVTDVTGLVDWIKPQQVKPRAKPGRKKKVVETV